MEDSITGPGPSVINEGKDINWHSLDKPKFYFYNVSFFLATRVILFPPLLIKTRLQVQEKQTIDAITGNKIPPKYNGMTDAAVKIFRNEGIRGLYKGFGISVLGGLPTQFFYISTLEYIRSNLPISSIHPMSGFIAGASASLVSTVIGTPMDIITQRLMVQDGDMKKNQYQYKGGFNAAYTIIKTEGMKGLYRGYGATLLTNASGSAVWWGIYASAKNLASSLLSTYDLHVSPVKEQAVHTSCGVFAGIMSAILTNPLDVAKTRLQVLKNEKKLNVFGVLKELYKEEGIKSFSRGLQARIYHMFIFSLIMSTVYENVKKLSVKT